MSALEQGFRQELSAELSSGIDETIDDIVRIYEPFLDFYHAEVARMNEEQGRIDRLDADLDTARDKVELVTRAEG